MTLQERKNEIIEKCKQEEQVQLEKLYNEYEKEEVTTFGILDFERMQVHTADRIIFSQKGEEAHQEVSPKRIDLTAEQIEQIKAIILAQ